MLRILARILSWWLVATALILPITPARINHRTQVCHATVVAAAFEGENPACTNEGRETIVSASVILAVGIGGLRLTRRRRRRRLRVGDPHAALRVVRDHLEVRGRPVLRPFVVEPNDVAAAHIGHLDLVELARIPRVLPLERDLWQRGSTLHVVLRAPLGTPPLKAEEWTDLRLTPSERRHGAAAEVLSLPASEDTEELLWTAGVPVVNDLGPVLRDRFGSADPLVAAARRHAEQRLALASVTARLLLPFLALLTPVLLVLLLASGPGRDVAAWAQLGAALAATFHAAVLWRERRRIPDAEAVATGAVGVTLAAVGAVLAGVIQFVPAVALFTFGILLAVGAHTRRSGRLSERVLAAGQGTPTPDPPWPPPGTIPPWYREPPIILAVVLTISAGLVFLVPNEKDDAIRRRATSTIVRHGGAAADSSPTTGAPRP